MLAMARSMRLACLSENRKSPFLHPSVYELVNVVSQQSTDEVLHQIDRVTGSLRTGPNGWNLAN